MHCPLVCGVIMLEVQRCCDKYCRIQASINGSWRRKDRGMDSWHGLGVRLGYPKVSFSLSNLEVSI